MNEIVEEYKQHYKKLHEEGNFLGGSLKVEYAKILKIIVEKTKSKTVLDYGCGKASHYKGENPINKLFGIDSINISLYDIGVPEYENLPNGTFDGVICTDVLEHIPESLIPETLATIFEKSRKFVFLVIHCGLAVKKLPNGENAHVTIKSPEWWNEKLKIHYTADKIVHTKYLIPQEPKYNILKL